MMTALLASDAAPVGILFIFLAPRDGRQSVYLHIGISMRDDLRCRRRDARVIMMPKSLASMLMSRDYQRFMMTTMIF